MTSVGRDSANPGGPMSPAKRGGIWKLVERRIVRFPCPVFHLLAAAVKVALADRVGEVGAEERAWKTQRKPPA